jgi:hypothetical protein
MIIGAVVGLSLAINVSVDKQIPYPYANAALGMRMSSQQKTETLQGLLHSATDCIVRAVTAKPRTKVSAGASSFNELVVTSLTACALPVRVLIQAYDRAFGEGAGVSFFLGPYLNELPAAVSKHQVKDGI